MLGHQNGDIPFILRSTSANSNSVNGAAIDNAGSSFHLPLGHGSAVPTTTVSYQAHAAGVESEGSSGPEMITLKVLSANESHPVRTLLLPASIGRVSDPRMRASTRNGLFTSRFLSRHHALIRVEGRRVVIEDLGSCNGTFVNGVAVKAGEAWPIADGDLLQFGSEDDDANNAAIVTQVFYDQPSLATGFQPPSLAPSLQMKQPAVMSGLATTKSGIDTNLMILGDPFAQNSPPAGTSETSAMRRSSSSVCPNTTVSLNSIASIGGANNTVNASVPGDAISSKIADITRALASFGVLMRTDISFRTRASSFITLQALEVIEVQLHNLANGEGGLLVEGAFDLLTHPTIHQRPNLMVAMRIIVPEENSPLLLINNVRVDLLRTHALHLDLYRCFMDCFLRGEQRVTHS